MKLIKWTLGILGILLITISIFIGFCMGTRSKNVDQGKKGIMMIKLEIDKTDLKYYGYTGVHLYAVQPRNENNNKVVLLNKSCEAVDLYKLYNDLATFLSNQTYLSPNKSTIKTYGVYGNPKHISSIEVEKFNSEELQIVGYLDDNDVLAFSKFLKENALGEMDGVAKYYEQLSDEVKEELEMLLDDRVIVEISGYLKFLNEFFDHCLESKSEVLIIFNA